MHRIIHIMVLAMALLSAGCNTVKGLGQDLQKAGEKISDTAKKM